MKWTKAGNVRLYAYDDGTLAGTVAPVYLNGERLWRAEAFSRDGRPEAATVMRALADAKGSIESWIEARGS